MVRRKKVAAEQYKYFSFFPTAETSQNRKREEQDGKWAVAGGDATAGRPTEREKGGLRRTATPAERRAVVELSRLLMVWFSAADRR
jgi:hypothetical protein